MKTLNLKTIIHRPLTLKQKLIKWKNKIDMGFRARVTQRMHWLKISERPIAYMDIDTQLELAFIALAKRYLYEELGEEIKYKNKTNMTFYKGFRLHSENDEKNIDACLDLINIYTKINAARRGVYSNYNYERMTKVMNEFVKQRGAMWI